MESFALLMFIRPAAHHSIAIAFAKWASRSSSITHFTRSTNSALIFSWSLRMPSWYEYVLLHSSLNCTTSCDLGLRTASYALKTLSTCSPVLDGLAPNSDASTYTSSIAWPAPAPRFGAIAYALSPSKHTRPLKYSRLSCPEDNLL